MWFCISWTPVTYILKLYKLWSFSWYMEKISYHSNIRKNDKPCINNYRPVSLLPICGKIFERYNLLFLYLESNNLLTTHQSGFRSNDSCIYQLLSIVNSIYADFDHNPSLEVWGNFLDNSKAFDKVWHEGLPYKLESIGISGNLLNLFRSFLNDRCQRVVINGPHSDWSFGH